MCIRRPIYSITRRIVLQNVCLCVWGIATVCLYATAMSRIPTALLGFAVSKVFIAHLAFCAAALLLSLLTSVYHWRDYGKSFASESQWLSTTLLFHTPLWLLQVSPLGRMITGYYFMFGKPLFSSDQDVLCNKTDVHVDGLVCLTMTIVVLNTLAYAIVHLVDLWFRLSRRRDVQAAATVEEMAPTEV
jgi:hypothetical protein